MLPRPETYAPLFTDLLERLGVPHRLHPSLPLRFGRSARSLLLLLRCRGLGRAAVMEFLTFAPIPFVELLGEDEDAQPPRWDAVSRDAGVVSGLDRWMIGLRAYAEAEREAGEKDSEERREQIIDSDVKPKIHRVRDDEPRFADLIKHMVLQRRSDVREQNVGR